MLGVLSRLATLAAVLSLLAPAAFARPSSFQAYVQIIGCSNSSQVFQAYDYASTAHVAVNSAINGQTVKEWSTAGSIAWVGRGGENGGPGFDANYALFGATAVWFPVCIRTGDYATNSKAYKAFQTFVSLLRQRTSAPLWLSPSIGTQATCVRDANSQMEYVVDKAVADGLALRGPDVPPASAPLADLCHFDPALSTNVQDVAVAFLDG